MSDATGFGSGGVSPLFKVGGRPAGESCALASENPLFTFAVYPEGNKIKQCQDVNFTWEGKATGSVFIFGVVPGGMLQVPPSPGTGGKQSELASYHLLTGQISDPHDSQSERQ